MRAKVLWFSGLSGSGKTTIANKLRQEIENRGYSVKVFDGDDVRNTEHKHLCFTREDIEENNRLIGQLCIRNINDYDFILVPVISPFHKTRESVRRVLGDSYIEIYIGSSLEECIRRDVKGLYKKALRGEIDNFIGISEDVPYEIPRAPEISLDTEKETIIESVQHILDYLQRRNAL